MAFLFLSAHPLALTTTYSKVIAIADGDTFTVIKDNKTIRVRIDAIDAPEKGMPYCNVSKKYLATMCFGKMVKLTTLKTDRYGRSIARIVLPDGKDVSTEMIKAGLAWHYKKYSSDKLLAAYEVQARKARIGLWKDKKPVAPWTVRKMHREGISTKSRFKDRVP